MQGIPRLVIAISFFCATMVVLTSCGTTAATTGTQAPSVRSGSIRVQAKETPVRRLRKKALRKKYAAMLDTKPRKIKNLKLYYFIEEWHGVPYQWGGNDKSGVDCSGFVRNLYAAVYGLQIKRTVATQHAETRNFRKKRRLDEGDIVYFRKDDDPSHAGIYLQNGYFVHSSRGRGVHISHLKDQYWKRTFAGGGKVRRKKT